MAVSPSVKIIKSLMTCTPVIVLDYLNTPVEVLGTCTFGKVLDELNTHVEVINDSDLLKP